MRPVTAEVVYREFTQLTSDERAKFFALLAGPSIHEENFSHDQVFGHLANDAFTAAEAADYLEVSLSTFRRYVGNGRIKACSEVGRSQLFSTEDLKAFKRALQQVKARSVIAAARANETSM